MVIKRDGEGRVLARQADGEEVEAARWRIVGGGFLVRGIGRAAGDGAQ